MGLLLPMRQARLKAPEGHPILYYHCISKMVNQEFVFADAEWERLVQLMREYEAFCGVCVLTYCILSNHLP